MRFHRRTLLAASAAALAAPAIIRMPSGRAQTGGPIRIGEINSYTAIPAFTLPYRMGWQLAVAEINGEGGIGGRPIEVLSRDDAGKPQDAVRLAAELLNDQKVALLTGTYLSNVGLAVADFALQNRALFVAAEPLTDALVWEKGNRFTFRLRPSTYMQAAMLVEEAAKLSATRWVTVAPNYEYGQSAVKWFKTLLAARRPDVQFVGEQWPALGRIDAGASVAALGAARPDAIYNVTFGPDLTNFVRQGNSRGLFERRAVISVLTGEPEYLDPLGDETPEGWIVTGYPWDQIRTPAHTAFLDAYRSRFNDHPRLGSIVGYATMHSIGAGLRKAASTDVERMIAAFRGLAFPTPFGSVQYRTIDQQSTLGAFVGRTAQKGGKGVMTDWRYADGANYLPPDAEVLAMRPAEARA